MDMGVGVGVGDRDAEHLDCFVTQIKRMKSERGEGEEEGNCGVSHAASDLEDDVTLPQIPQLRELTGGRGRGE